MEQKITSTTPHTTANTTAHHSDGDICSDDEKYLAGDSAAPARAVAAMAVAHAPGTKKSLPATVVERIWKTKGRSKRPKKSNVPAHVLQAAAPAPVPLVAVDQAAARTPVEMKSPPVLPATLAVASAHVEMKPPPVLPAELAVVCPSIRAVLSSRS